MEQEVVGAKEVADKYEVDVRQVHYARKRGKLEAFKIGWVWVFPVSTLPDEWPVRRLKRRA